MDIFIGLGGLGTSTVNKLSATKFSNDSAYFSIDESCDNNSCDSNIHCLQLRTSHTVGECVSYYSSARQWFPMHPLLINHFCVSSCAIRVLGRLIFEVVMDKFKIIPETAYNQKSQVVNIHIVSSIMGGTGSAIILPLVLWLKNQLKDYNATVKFFGHLITPENIFEKISSITEQNGLKVNSVATIIELEGFIEKYATGVNENLEIEFFNNEEHITKLFDGLSLIGDFDFGSGDCYENIAKQIIEGLSEENDYMQQIKILDKEKIKYIDTYLDSVSRLYGLEEYEYKTVNAITPHINVKWHEYLKKYVL